MILIDLIGALCASIPFLLLTLQLLNKLHLNKKGIIYFVFISIGTAVLLALSTDNPLLNLSIAVLILAFLLSKIYKVKFTFSLLSLLLSVILLLIVEYVGIYILNLFYVDSLTYIQTRYIAALINASLLTLFFLFLKSLNWSLLPNHDIYSARNSKLWWTSPVFVVLTLLIVVEIIQNGVTIASVYLIITSIIAFIYLIRYIIYQKTVEAEKLMVNVQEKSAKFYLRGIQAQRHDFIFQINTINSLVHLNRIEELKSYLGELTEEIQTTSETLPLHYISTAGLLIQYKQIFKKDGVNFKIIVEDTFEGIPMKVYEFNNIIGNLITNAFESVRLIEANYKEITIKFSKDQHLVVEVINEINQDSFDLMNIFQDGFTTKEKGKNGLGINNIMMILEQYNGYLYPELNNQTLSMFVIIPHKNK
ncbi:GHKL domain-containing protein [Niallia taxi]|uniref:sensor histidine kinase n=1 Tax=Niallia taxi TaxID=2499688 RepID=UPI0039826CE8